MGKPNIVKAILSRVELSRYEKHTGGTETSKYPQENKSKEIPLVVASEAGTAQTINL